MGDYYPFLEMYAAIDMTSGHRDALFLNRSTSAHVFPQRTLNSTPEVMPAYFIMPKVATGTGSGICMSTERCKHWGPFSLILKEDLFYYLISPLPNQVNICSLILFKLYLDNLERFHLLAIVYRRDIKSLRDLNGTHVSVLENIYKSTVKIKEKLT